MMGYTVLMTAVLIFSYALMFGLVSFAEYIIGRREFEPTGEEGVGITGGPNMTASDGSGSTG
jgi:hypothetical protein